MPADRPRSTCSSSWRRTTCAGTPSASSWPWPSPSSTRAVSHGNARAQVLADTLDRATGTFLEEGRSPSRKVGEIDNRGSHFYLALYWAQELAKQTDDAELASKYTEIAADLAENEQTIVDELAAVQGAPVDIEGYYSPSKERVFEAMRPSATLNAIVAKLAK